MRIHKPRIAATALILTCLGAGKQARATEETGDRELRAAEQAYRDVDFAGTHEHAIAGLAAGGARPERVARLSVLAGVSAAALERSDEARSAFIVALAVAPSLKLERSLSPKLRGPYLEAQGYWGAYADRLSLRAGTRDGAHIAVRLADPGHLVSKIVLSLRAHGESGFRSTPPATGASTSFAVPAGVQARDFEYFVRGFDSHGNILTEAGSEDAPLAYDHPVSTAPSAAPPKTRSYIVPATFAVLGLGAATVGVVFHLKREDSASTWNGPGCERPGPRTRLEQCGNVDDDIRRDGRIAVISYAAAGALLSTAAVTWFIGAGSRRDAKADTAAAPTACGITGAGFGCAGRF